MTKKYDVVIVGAGLSGFAAAARAADQKLATLLVEKGTHTGGSGNYVEGLFAADSALQKKQAIKINKADILQEELDYSHYEANHDMWQKYIDQAGENIDWLQQRGVEFSKVATLGTGAPTWHLFKGLGSHAIHAGLEPYVKQAGVELLTQTRVTAIQKQDQLFTVTLTQVQDNTEQQVTAKSVVLATGGYLNDENLMETTSFSKKQRILPMNSGKNTGDGLKLAWQLGGQKFFTGMRMRFGAQMKDSQVPPYKLWGSVLGGLTVGSQPSLLVNENGQRFIDENHAIDDWASQGNAMSRQERVFYVMDQKFVDRLTDTGIIKDMHPFYDQKTLPGLRDEVNDAVQQHRDYMNVAASLDELQDKLQTPHLVETIKHYNQLVKQHQDTDYHKPSQYLYSIDQGPFYAIEIGCGAYTTGDGLKVNTHNEVLDDDGQAITGLYAVGSDGSGIMYGDTYGVEIPGSHAGFCVFSGKNAIDHLVKTVLVPA